MSLLIHRSPFMRNAQCHHTCPTIFVLFFLHVSLCIWKSSNTLLPLLAEARYSSDGFGSTPNGVMLPPGRKLNNPVRFETFGDGRWPYDLDWAPDGRQNFVGGVVEKGYLYLCPYFTHGIVRVNLDSGNMNYYDNFPSGMDTGNDYPWYMQMVHQDGDNRIFLVPYTSNMFVVFNINDRTLTQLPFPAPLYQGNSNGFNGGVITKGKLYLMVVLLSLILLHQVTAEPHFVRGQSIKQSCHLLHRPRIRRTFGWLLGTDSMMAPVAHLFD